MAQVRLGLMTVKGTKHLLCSVGASGPDVWICWPDKMEPQPYRLALTPEESKELRKALVDAEHEAARIRDENEREFQRWKRRGR